MAIWIDKYIVRTFVGFLNLIVKIVGKLLRLDHSLDRSFNRIYISKYKGMGSIVQSIPLLHGLRNKYPKASIVFISTKGNKGILDQLYPLIDGNILLDDSSLWRLLISLPSFFWNMVRTRAQVFIDLEVYADVASVFTTISLATNRLGFYQRASQYKTGIYTHMLFFNNNAPIAENYKQMARLLGVTDFSQKTKVLLDNKVSTRDTPYIVINPNASDLRLERRWDASNFILLIKMLLQERSEDVILIGSKSEVPYVQAIFDSIPQHNKLINLAGRTDLQGLLGVIAHAKIVITNDTGPMHLSLYYNRPTVALFGPCHPRHYGVIKNNVYIHYTPVFCSPCVHEFQQAPCKGKNICMSSIIVHEVYQSVVELGKGNIQPQISNDIIYTQGDSFLGLLQH